MAIKVGDTVLVSHGSLLLDAEVKELQKDVENSDTSQVLVQYSVESGRSEWVARDRVLEDTQTNRELQEKVKAINHKKHEIASPSASFDKICGPNRLNAMAAWMNTVGDALTQLDQAVKDLMVHQANGAAQLIELERRKKEVIQEKAALEVAVLKDLKRVRVAEETAMARKRLQNAGISREEIDAILPVIPHVG